MKKTICLFTAFLAIQISVFSQDKPSSKSSSDVSNAIERFKNTDFMVKYNDLKSQIQDDAQDFIANQNKYSTKDIRKVQLAYDKTSARFNQMMLVIKLDFLDKEKIKMINKYPQMYSDGLSSKINELDRFYKENFQLTLSEVTEKDGSAILAILVELIKASGDLSSYFKGIKYEKQAMTEEYIQKNLIEPSKFPSWKELVSVTNIKTDVYPSDNANKPKETKNDMPSIEDEVKSGEKTSEKSIEVKTKDEETKVEVDDKTAIEKPQTLKVNKTPQKIEVKKKN